MLIISPALALLFFHFIPNEISKNNLYKNGIKTVAKIEFYSTEKEPGTGKFGMLSTNFTKYINYSYLDIKKNEFRGKIKSKLVFSTTLDSTFQVLFLKDNPTEHLLIISDKNHILGKSTQ